MFERSTLRPRSSIRPLDELVALVEVPHPPPEGLAGERRRVVDPLADRQPRTQRRRPARPGPGSPAAPHRRRRSRRPGRPCRPRRPAAEAAVLMNWLARSVGRFPKNQRHDRRVEERPAVAARERPEPEGSGVRGANSVGAESRTRFLSGPSGNSEAYMAHSVPPWDWPKRLTSSAPEVSSDLLDRAVQVVQDEVLERQLRVLGAGDPEVEQVDVESLRHQVLDQAVAGYQVQDVWLEHEPVDQEHRHRTPLSHTPAGRR